MLANAQQKLMGVENSATIVALLQELQEYSQKASDEAK